ncbi:PREDICTED: breast carcinoma-amplified sequence 1 [Chrysochloris asiatica]|uniref:Breast carcinoma-amplified sequence 1 n=1 Tax=Chrysochloris asiatica TaxID=185453 RepID=A0A9B0WKL8_CHRAS|nr:PREDICTED: breast carcinoma-amplified sequence 1 [Chrysochloris asiatica]
MVQVTELMPSKAQSLALSLLFRGPQSEQLGTIYFCSRGHATMGNQMSVPQRVEDQEDDLETITDQVVSGNECSPNGVPRVLSTCTIQHCDQVDLGISIREDNAAGSSPKTVEISNVADANGKNLGKEARPEAPAAKSRFFLRLSPLVPGRAGDEATDSSAGSGQLDVSCSKASGNKGPSESMVLPAAAAAGPGPNKSPGQAPAEDEATAACWGPEPLPLESEGAVPAKRKDPSFFDRVFKLDQAREKAPGDRQPETQRALSQESAVESAVSSGPPHHVPAEQDLVDSKEKGGQEVIPLSSSILEVPEELDTEKENPQTTNTAENNSIMSFFKTLVSSNKAETKKDPEDMGAEKSPPTSADPKSEKANFTPQETQGAAKSPKGCNPSGPSPSAAASETAKEGAKEKTGPTSMPLGKLFWKKSIKEDSVPTGPEENAVYESPVEMIKSEEIESALQTVDLNEDGDAVPEPAEVKPKQEDSKPARSPLMMFFRQMSVKGDGGNTVPEGINGKGSACQTSDSTEKVPTPPEPEPATIGQKGKDGNSKDKKSAAEMNKQKSNKPEAKEPAPCVEQGAVEVSSLQSGSKRPEKQRQSFRGLLKGLGSKRMLDAQVQTDPVSIGPIGKSK